MAEKYENGNYVQEALVMSRKGYYIQINFEKFMGRLRDLYEECEKKEAKFQKNCVANEVNAYIQERFTWINKTFARRPQESAEERELRLNRKFSSRKAFEAAELKAQKDALYKEEERITEYNALNYFEHRRWIPMRVGFELNASEVSIFNRSKAPEGLELLVVPLRSYPRKGVAGHLLGSVKRSSWSEGPIKDGEVLYPTIVGMSGLEKAQNEQLNGEDTVYLHRFDENGKELTPIVDKIGRAGLDVVLSLDVKMQVKAEELLAKHTERGAFIVLDIESMEVKAIASNPTLNPNVYVPTLSAEKEAFLLEQGLEEKDKAKPLLSRAFKATYPPASVFKLATGLMGLEGGIIGPDTYDYQCKKSIRYGSEKPMNNWDTEADDEPMMDLRLAIKRSCNTWFFQMANDLYSRPRKAELDFNNLFFKLMPDLGLGRRTGLEVSNAEQSAGYMYLNQEGARQPIYAQGDVASVAIGQKNLLVTPLQMAQMIARITKPHTDSLVHVIAHRQTDNYDVLPVAIGVDGVSLVKDAQTGELKYDANNLQTIRYGMWDVVNARNGTAGAARGAGFVVAGKTGSAEWAGNKNVAWFASYAPYNQPKYVVVAMKEGLAGQELSGGKDAAPMVGEFYNSAYVSSRLRSTSNRKVLKAEPVTEADLMNEPEYEEYIPKAIPVE